MAFDRTSTDPTATTNIRAHYATVIRAEEVRDLIVVDGAKGRADIDLAISDAGAKVYQLAEVALGNVIARTRRNASFDQLRAEIDQMVDEWVEKLKADAGTL